MAAKNGAFDGNHDAARDHDVIIVGGGFGGVYALYKVRQLGLSVKVLEAGSRYGGVWHWNRCKCTSDREMGEPGPSKRFSALI